MPAAKNAAASKRVKPITAAEFDRRAEAGEDLSDHIDWGRPMTDREFVARHLPHARRLNGHNVRVHVR